jgi:hypothetical protein
MDSISATAVLTAMITPAVLISACGSMVLSTSSRLGRVVDRVRALSDRLEGMSKTPGDADTSNERKAVIFDQLDKLTSRARILQRSMVAFYLGLGMFGHKCGDWRRGTRRQAALHYRASDTWYRRSMLPFLRQHASHI